MYNKTPLNKRRLWSHVTWLLFPATCLSGPSIHVGFVLKCRSDWMEIHSQTSVGILENVSSISETTYPNCMTQIPKNCKSKIITSSFTSTKESSIFLISEILNKLAIEVFNLSVEISYSRTVLLLTTRIKTDTQIAVQSSIYWLYVRSKYGSERGCSMYDLSASALLKS